MNCFIFFVLCWNKKDLKFHNDLGLIYSIGKPLILEQWENGSVAKVTAKDLNFHNILEYCCNMYYIS